MGRAAFVTVGILRLLATILACVALAALAYLAIMAWILALPPHSLR